MSISYVLEITTMGSRRTTANLFRLPEDVDGHRCRRETRFEAEGKPGSVARSSKMLLLVVARCAILGRRGSVFCSEDATDKSKGEDDMPKPAVLFSFSDEQSGWLKADTPVSCTGNDVGRETSSAGDWGVF